MSKHIRFLLRLLYRFPIDFIFFRSKTTPFFIPVLANAGNAGIPFFSGCLDSRLRRNDENLLRMGIRQIQPQS